MWREMGEVDNDGDERKQWAADRRSVALSCDIRLAVRAQTVERMRN